MNLSIVGAGYVGLVTGLCLAEAGHQVSCVDVDVDKIMRLAAGHLPIHEPGLDVLLEQRLLVARHQGMQDQRPAPAQVDGCQATLQHRRQGIDRIGAMRQHSVVLGQVAVALDDRHQGPGRLFPGR